MAFDADTVDISSKAAIKFTSTFYDCMDNKRHLLMKLYGDTSVCVWNGNAIEGNSQIFQFLSQIPTSSHEILSIDSQPMLQGNILVQVCGSVHYESSKKLFSQTFILSSITGFQYVIGSDTFRFT
jgi:NTF2-related export protein 1/2